MPKTKMEAVEEMIKNQKIGHLRALLQQYAVKVKIFKVKKDEYSAVYGEDSGAVDDALFDEVEAIITSDDFFPSGPSSSGSFVEGWLYTFSDKVTVGKTVEIRSGDGRTRRYKAESVWAVGSTTDVFRRVKLASLAAQDSV